MHLLDQATRIPGVLENKVVREFYYQQPCRSLDRGCHETNKGCMSRQFDVIGLMGA